MTVAKTTKPPEPGDAGFSDPPIPPTQQPEPKPQKGQIVHDPEILAMQRIKKLIDKLPNEPSKIRVIEWLKSKIEFPLADQST